MEKNTVPSSSHSHTKHRRVGHVHTSTGRDDESDDISFIKNFAVSDVARKISLAEEEKVADALVREALQKSRVYQAEHDTTLPDHLEKFRLEYEESEKKRMTLSAIPTMSTLSPRTKKEISLLPPPNQYVERKIEKLEALSAETDPNDLYLGLASKKTAPGPTRFTDIMNSHKVLIPNNIASGTNQDSIEFFETMEAAKRRKLEQDERLRDLFNKYDDAPTRSKKHGSVDGSSSSSSSKLASNRRRHAKRGSGTLTQQSKLPRLAFSGHAVLNEFIANKKRAASPTLKPTQGTGGVPAQRPPTKPHLLSMSRTAPHGITTGKSMSVTGNHPSPHRVNSSQNLSTSAGAGTGTGTGTGSGVEEIAGMSVDMDLDMESLLLQKVLGSNAAEILKHEEERSSAARTTGSVDVSCSTGHISRSIGSQEDSSSIGSSSVATTHTQRSLDTTTTNNININNKLTRSSPQVSLPGRKQPTHVGVGVGASHSLKEASLRPSVPATATAIAAATGAPAKNRGPEPGRDAHPLQNQHRGSHTPAMVIPATTTGGGGGSGGGGTALTTDIGSGTGTAGIDVDELEAEYAPLMRESFDHARQVSAAHARKQKALEKLTAKLGSRSEQEYLNLFSVKVLDEMGLDLNKEYNKIRNYTQYLMNLSFHFYMQRLTSGFGHFKAQYLKIREARIARARRTVYRTVKMGVYWLTANERNRRAREQAEEEARLIAAEQANIRRCRGIIFNAILLYTKTRINQRRLLHRRKATLIQQRVRGMIGRRLAREWKERHAFLTSQALAIQCSYRQHLARRRLRLFQKLQFVANWLEETRLVSARRRQKLKEDGAELFIAKAYRTLVFRRKLQTLLYWHRYRSAVAIQRIFLGYRIRKRWLKTWSLYLNKQSLRHSSMVIIQRCVRGFVARMKLHHLALKKRKQDQARRQQKMYQYAMVQGKVRLTFRFVQWYRSMKPLRYKMLHVKATHIQRIWRAWYGRKRALIVRTFNAIERMQKRHTLEMKSALRIQRRWRSYMSRVRQIRKKTRSRIVLIQTLFRIACAKRRLRRMKKFNIAARQLTAMLRRLVFRWRFHKRWLWAQQRAPEGIKIQKMWRLALARKRVGQFRKVTRTAVERNLYLTTRINQLLAEAELQLIKTTLVHPLGHKPTTYSGEDCPCLGPLQAVFTHAACNKGRTDPVALVTNKSDAGTLAKMLFRIKGVMDSKETAAALKEDHKKKKKTGKLKGVAKTMAMLQEFDAGRIPLPQVKRKLKVNQLDIIFSRARSSAASGNVLSYLEFTEMLRLLGVAHFSTESEAKAAATKQASPGKEGEGEEDAGAMRLASRSDDKNASPAGDNADAMRLASRSDDKSVSSPGAAVAVAVERTKREGTHALTPEEVRCDMRHVIDGADPDYRLALVLKVFSSLRTEEWMAPVLAWVEAESQARIGVFATRIQSLARKVAAKKRVAERIVEIAEDQESARFFFYAARIQALVRMFLYRYRLARLAQKTITRYNPHFGEPYWYNPISQVRSTTKPAVLRSLEAYTIALPEEGLENTVSCFYCNRPAVINCCDCEDSFCKVCYESLHCKGTRARHQSMKIPNCAYCKFQVATKSCLSCILNAAPHGHIRESIDEHARGHYCDTCFVFEHDKNTKALSVHNQKKKDLKNVLSYSKQAYLVKQYLHQKCITNHHYEELVQPCEECQWRASTWRCVDCNQVYCNTCLVGLHSMGGAFARHHAEQLPYFTPAMHESFKHDVVTQIIQNKLEKLNRVERIRREKLHHHKAIKIQSWWRMVVGRFAGRKYMKRVRRRHRIAYRNYQNETKETRQGRWFKLLRSLGQAPELATDNRQDAALRSIWAFKRESAIEVISANLEDWGHYRLSRVLPRKGVPKTGFNCGTQEELEDQAKRGGYRLPGKVHVVPGAQEFNTTCDLTQVLRAGEYVRIRERLFGVVKVQPESVKVNRFWRAGTEADAAGDEGEVMYRAPMYKGEPRRNEYRRKYLLYAALVENPVTQLGFAISKFHAKRMMTFSLYMVRTNRRNGMTLEADTWRTSSVKYADRIRRLNSYFNTTSAMMSHYGEEKWQPKKPKMESDPLMQSMVKKRSPGLLESIEARSQKHHHYQQQHTRKQPHARGRQQVQVHRSGSRGVGAGGTSKGGGGQVFDVDDHQLLDSDDDSQASWDESPQPLEKRARQKPQPRPTSRGSDGIGGGGGGGGYTAVAVGEEEEEEEGEEGVSARAGQRGGMPSSRPSSSSSQRPGSGKSRKKSRKDKDQHAEAGGDGGASDGMEDGGVAGSPDDGVSGKTLLSEDQSGKSRRRGGFFGLFGGNEESEKVQALADQMHKEASAGGPAAGKSVEELMEERQRRKSKRKPQNPTEPWYATAEQAEERQEREDKMTPQELALEADDWKENVDIMTENIYYQNIKTNELMSTIPRAVAAKRQIEFENSKNKKNYDEAQKRILKLENAIKHRTLITGGRRKS